MKKELREKAVALRLEKKLSYSEIRKRLGVPKSTLSYWLRDYPLSESRISELRKRGWKNGEAGRERYRNTMMEKYENEKCRIYNIQKKNLRNLKKEAQYVAGLMLYLGEGAKKDRYTISLANTDPDLLRYFIRWLGEYLGISKKDLRVQLHLYKNMDVKKEQKFWENVLDLEKSQFYKLQIRELRKGSFSYRESFRHGTCQINFFNKEKKMNLMMAIEAFIDLYVK
tara:strand:- start:1985 stop:2662 length:678 start_codon:yes stop_codon:yes gene_type:complete